MSKPNYKVICTECGWFGHYTDVLHASNKFDTDIEISVCPKCKAIDHLIVACDEPGCWKHVACGMPTAAGYRSTCCDHKPNEEE